MNSNPYSSKIHSTRPFESVNFMDLTEKEKQVLKAFHKFPVFLDMWTDITALKPYETITIQKDKRGKPDWYQLDKRQRKEFKI